MPLVFIMSISKGGRHMAILATTGSAPAGILGYLAFMGFGDMKVHKSDLEQSFTSANLSLQQYQPGDIRQPDAMRRATSLLKNKKVEIMFNGQKRTAVIDVTEYATDTEVLRYIGRKVVDDKNMKITYDSISLIHFDKAQGTLSFEPVDTAFLTEYNYEVMLQDIMDKYIEWCQYHTKDTVRNIFNKVVNSLMPTPVAAVPGEPSVAKFIPVAYESTLIGMQQVIKDLKPHHLNGAVSGCQYIELVDSDINKQMINAAVHGDVKAKVQTLVHELQSTLQKNGSITVKSGQILANKLMEIKKEVQHYEDLLGASMTILEQQIVTALMKVDDAPRPEVKDPSLGTVL